MSDGRGALRTHTAISVKIPVQTQCHFNDTGIYGQDQHDVLSDVQCNREREGNLADLT